MTLAREIQRAPFSDRFLAVSNLMVTVTIPLVLLYLAWQCYQDASWGTAQVLILLALVTPFSTGWMCWYTFRTMREQREVRLRYIQGLDEEAFLAIEEEISQGQLAFEVFYLLKDYLYVPRLHLLMPYEAMKDWSTVRKLLNGHLYGAQLEITDKEDYLWTIDIKDWRQYLMVEEEINQEIRRALAEENERKK